MEERRKWLKIRIHMNNIALNLLVLLQGLKLTVGSGRSGRRKRKKNNYKL